MSIRKQLEEEMRRAAQEREAELAASAPPPTPVREPGKEGGRMPSITDRLLAAGFLAPPASPAEEGEPRSVESLFAEGLAGKRPEAASGPQ